MQLVITHAGCNLRLNQFQRLHRMAVLQQRLGVFVGQRTVIGVGLPRITQASQGIGFATGELDAATEQFHHGVLFEHRFQGGKFLACRGHILQAQQCAGQPVTRTRLGQVALLGEQIAKIHHALACRLEFRLELCPYQVEVNRVRHLTVRQIRRTALHVGNAFVGQRMGAQVRGGATVRQTRGALQALEKQRHAVGIKACFFQHLQAHAVRFALKVA